MSEISEAMVETTLEIIDKMFYESEKINISSVAKKGKVSRQFLYNHAEILDKISYYQNFNALSVEERFNTLKSQNQELIKRLERFDNYALEILIKHGSGSN